MANNLRAFMPDKVEEIKPISFVVSKRFKSKDGKPIEWLLMPLTAMEDGRIRRECTKKVKGKNGIRIPDFDTDKYMGMMIAACVIEPNLKDSELQNAWGVMGESDLLKKMLVPGEHADLANKVQEINGYDVTMEDLVEEAKN